MGLSSEFELVEKIKGWTATESSGVHVGIGDDCAVLSVPSGKVVATTDCLIEGTHFDLNFCRPDDIGYKALAINLSDIASMGATAHFAMVSLTLTEKQDDVFVESFYHGMMELARAHGVSVVGGNLSVSQRELSVHLSVLGAAETYLTRTGARPGDWVAVTGETGRAAAGLSALSTLGAEASNKFPKLTKAWLRPAPRLNEMKLLKESGAVTSAIDISDGLSSELGHLAKGSHCGFLIDQARIPVSKEVVDYSALLQANEVETTFEWVMNGGEDYEVLMTLNPAKRKALEKCLEEHSMKLYVIGEVKYPSDGVVLKTRDGALQLIPAKGWKHFK